MLLLCSHLVLSMLQLLVLALAADDDGGQQQHQQHQQHQQQHQQQQQPPEQQREPQQQQRLSPPPTSPISLSGSGWTASSLDDGPVPDGRGPVGPLPALVPGEIHDDLMRASLLPDLWVGDGTNLSEAAWVGWRRWNFERSFFAPPPSTGVSRWWLRFEGVMWNCTVRLNGVNLGSHVGQFEPFEFDISALLRAPGVRNTLTVTTIPFVDGNVTRFKQEIFNSPTYTHQVSCWLNVHAPQWMGRTIYGWDFVPALYSAGIWRDVLLHPTGIAPLPSNGGGVSVVAATAAATVAPLSKSPVAATVTLRAKSLGVIPRPEPPYRRVPLQLTLEVELIELAPSVSNGTVSFQCEWTIASPDGVQVARLSVPYTVHVATGSTTQTLRANATLISPRLWWPNGYGSQPIYTARATMIATVGRRLLDSATATFGVRELKVSTNPHLRQGWSYTQYGPEHTWSPPWGWGDWQASTKPPIPPNATAWQVAINGRKVFLRGGNWIPRDQLFGRGVRQTNRTTAILQAAAFAGFTWMRIWGGGLIEDQHFYDECDRLGLMLLQEFPHAGCSPGGPGDSTPDYSWRMPLDKLQTQMALKQLVNHPSAPCTP